METTAWREFPEHGIRIYAPTSPGDRYRILFRDAAGKERERSGGKSERTALERAQALARELATGVDGTWTVGRLLDEYVVPTNHRTRRGRPWGDRYAEEEARRVRLHIRPQLDLRKHPDKLEPQDFIRVLNVAGVGRQESTVETIGKTCRAIISYGQRRRVITGDAMLGVHYTVQATEQDGDAQRIDPATIPTLDGVVDLALYAALKAHANAAEARTLVWSDHGRTWPRWDTSRVRANSPSARTSSSRVTVHLLYRAGPYGLASRARRRARRFLEAVGEGAERSTRCCARHDFVSTRSHVGPWSRSGCSVELLHEGIAGLRPDGGQGPKERSLPAVAVVLGPEVGRGASAPLRPGEHATRVIALR